MPQKIHLLNTKNRPAVGRISILAELGLRPIQAEPVQDDARRIVEKFVLEYNNVRLHSAIQYVTPADKLAGRAQTILAGRDAKLAAAREARRAKRQQEIIPA